MNILTICQLKMIELILNHMKNHKNTIIEKVFINSNQFGLFDIDQYEKEILAVDDINERIETKDKWNQMNLLNMQSMLGANCRMPLLHMSKSCIWLEETNECINEFSIVYTMNPTLYRNIAFKDQMKVCFKHTFGQDTTSHINKHYRKKSTRVLALVIFYESGGGSIRKLFRVLSCVL